MINIPTVLIDTTISEFKAEGYVCRSENVETTDKKQTVGLYFEKEETAADEN